MAHGVRTVIFAALVSNGLALAQAQRATRPVAGLGGTVATLEQGTKIEARLDRGLDTFHNRAGDRFSATVNKSVVIEGKELIPKGSKLRGRVIVSEPRSRWKGGGKLVLALESLEINRRHYRIDAVMRRSLQRFLRGRNMIFMGAGTGAAIGAIAGGGFGAAVGAGSGAAAGFVTALVTSGPNARMPAESVVHFALQEPVRVRT